MATIYEVAARAGVSPATVSRVLNGQRVSADKTRRVHDAARELRYTPNRTARRLRRQTSELIALLIPDIENPFFTALARGVEDRAQEAGFSVVLCNTDDDPAKETRYLDIANSEHMAGVILAPAAVDGDISHADRRMAGPVVAVDRHTGFDIDSVMVDNRRRGHRRDQRAVRCRLPAGRLHRRARTRSPTTEERRLGWQEALTRQGPRVHQVATLGRHGDFRVDGGRAAMLDLLALGRPAGRGRDHQQPHGRGRHPGAHRGGPGAARPRGRGHRRARRSDPAARRRSSRCVCRPATSGVTAASMLLERIDGDTQPARTVVFRAEVRARRRTGAGIGCRAPCDSGHDDALDETDFTVLDLRQTARRHRGGAGWCRRST